MLFRCAERRGKTAGLNAVLPRLRGEIVVFSDANAMYEPDAIRRLVRGFGDPQVGGVVGEARYLQGTLTTARVGERVYWGYEIRLKRYETALGAMVGGDGAIYAIRKGLWWPLPDNAINDFLNPLQIVAAGWRVVYEPDAVCYEEAAGAVRREWKRRVRIVGRSWRAVFQVPQLLNPFRFGLFTLCLVSHKVLRWLSALFMAGAVIGAIGMAVHNPPVAAGLVGVALTALIGAAVPPVRRTLGFAAYFVAINAASLVGVWRGTFGQVSGIWTTPRGADRGAGMLLRPGPVVLAAIALAAVAATALIVMRPGSRAVEAVFFASIGVIAYVYFLYPVLLAVTGYLRRPIVREDITPTVCLLIAANNEEAVIAAKIENSLRLDYPAGHLHVLVASDGSVDRTNAIVSAYAGPRVTLFALPERRGKMAAINRAVAKTTADVVVFSDANTFLEPDAVRTLVRSFADPNVGAVSGDVVLTGRRAMLAGSEDLYYRYERRLQQLESHIGSMIGVDGALYAIRRPLFCAPPDDTILDDMAIPMAVVRAGYRVVFEAGARASEAGSETAAEEFARKSRVIAGAVQFLLRRDSAVPLRRPQVLFSLVSHKALRWLSPGFAALAFAAALSLAPRSSWFAAAAAIQSAVLLLGAAGCIPALRRFEPVALVHYLCLVQAAAAVGVIKGVFGRQHVTWRRFVRSTRVELG